MTENRAEMMSYKDPPSQWQRTRSFAIRGFAHFSLLLLLAACSNPLGSSTSAQVNFLSSGLSLTDNSASLFGAGASQGTAWDSSNSLLRLDQAGSATDLELDRSWTPAWSNLVGYWKLNGTGAIASGSTIAASIGSSGTAFSANMSYVTGQLNQGISFDGASTYIDLGTPAALNGFSAVTIGVWINSSNLTGNRDIYSHESSIKLRTDNANLEVMISTNGGGWTSSCAVGTLTTNTWYYVVATYNGTSQFQMFINGVLAGSCAGSGAVTPYTSHNQISGYSGANEIFSGIIDDLAIWNTALSASAVASIYQHQVAKYAGTFTSRVMDGFTLTSWKSLQWITSLPFFKELPDFASGSVQSENISDYSSLYSSSLMTGIAGLWHLDETSGATVRDASGNGKTGTVETGVTLGVAGKFASGASFDGAHGYIPIGPTTTGQNVTYSMWVNPTAYNGAGSALLWDDDTQSGGDSWIGLNANGTVQTNRFGDGFGVVTSSTVLQLGKWYHVVFRANTVNPQASIFINGHLDASSSTMINSRSGKSYVTIGRGFDGGSFVVNPFQGSIDEVAIWNRSLSDTEILQLYRRGANRIKYQTRTCVASDCSDDPNSSNWKGPDGTSQTYFSELNDNTIANDGGDLGATDIVRTTAAKMTFANFTSLLLPSNRYFQYRAVMESDDSGTSCNYNGTPTWCSPELNSVSAQGP